MLLFCVFCSVYVGTCRFLFSTCAIAHRCIILQGSGLGLVALWPDLCFAQGATVEFSRMSFYCGCRLDHSSKLCLMVVIFSTTKLYMLSTRCTLERRLSFLESSQLLAPLPSSPPRLSTTPTPSSSSPWLSSSKPITSKFLNNSHTMCATQPPPFLFPLNQVTRSSSKLSSIPYLLT